MTDLLALIVLMLFPLKLLFWTPVHGLSRIFKKLGLLTYTMPLITWLPLAYLIYINRAFMLQFKIDLSVVLNIIGISLLSSGTLLHIWTGKLLGLWGLIGVPEVSNRVKGKLIIKGPFSALRHPTYLAHTMMFSGVFLITGVIAVAIVTSLDFVIINTVIIPLEERELLSRFGRDYELYKKKVPYRFFPLIM